MKNKLSVTPTAGIVAKALTWLLMPKDECPFWNYEYILTVLFNSCEVQ